LGLRFEAQRCLENPGRFTLTDDGLDADAARGFEL
jgi:hypothetical protein